MSRVFRLFLAFLKSIPVIFITALIVWSYYAYVVQLCLFTVPSTVEKVAYLIFYHVLLIMMSWSFWKAIFTPAAVTPPQYQLSSAVLEQYSSEVNEANRKEILDQAARNLPVQCRTLTGEIRYCNICKAIKPDRAHHCSICARCILKMDHHCPWINNCVCFSNYKFFLLFLVYALTYCVYVALTSLQYFIKFWLDVGVTESSMGGLHIVFVFIVAMLFAICVLILFSFHCFLVARNRSTLEDYQVPVFQSGPDKDGFNLGCYNNFLEVFGSSKCLWLLPVHSSFGDGVSFCSRTGPSDLNYNSMESTIVTLSQSVSSVGEGLSFPVLTVDEDYDSLLGQRQRWTEDGENNGFVNEAVRCDHS